MNNADTERAKFLNWLRTYEQNHGALDEESAFAGWQAARSATISTESHKKAQQELEELKQKFSRVGLDVDRATKGIVNEDSPIAARLKYLAELVSSL